MARLFTHQFERSRTVRTRYTLLAAQHTMPMSKTSPAETILIDLVHDLRQHLGNIETSAYCLGLICDSTQTRVHSYLHIIEQQVARAEGRLSEAGAAVSRLRTQRAEPAEILDLTNSTTSAVT